MGIFTNKKKASTDSVDNNAEAAASSEKKDAKKTSFRMRDVLNGSFLTKDFVQKQVPFILFLAVLALFYINNRFSYEEQIKEQNNLKKELIDAKYRSLTVSEELIQKSKQSAVMQQLQQQGSELQESLTPPIEVEK